MSDVEQRGQAAANQQISLGLTARDPAALPSAVDAGDGVDAISDLYGRQQVYIAGALPSATVTTNVASGSITITGTASSIVSGTTTSLTLPVAAANSTLITAAGTALAANTSRTKWSIQNVGTLQTYIYLGAASSISAATTFSFVLAPDIATDNGYGGKEQGYNYTGQISCAAGTTGGAIRLSVVEL